MPYLQFYSRGTRERTIAFTTIQNRTLLSGAHPGSQLKVNFHHMANDTLPLVSHTERHGRLICTREETGAVRVRVLRVVTPKTSRQRRILSKTWGRQCALSESSFGARGWGKTHRFLLPATTPPYAKSVYTKHAYESVIPRLYILFP